MLLGPQLLKGVEQNRKWIEKQACEEITGTEDEELKKGDSKGTAGVRSIQYCNERETGHCWVGDEDCQSTSVDPEENSVGCSFFYHVA